MEFKEHGKTSSNRSNCGQTAKLIERERRALKHIVGRKHRTTAAKVTAELNQHLNIPVSTKTVRRELNKTGYHGKTAIKKPLLSTINIQKRSKWCREHKCWSTYQWKQVRFSDESRFSLFPTAERAYVWRQPRETYNPDSLMPTVKHGGGSVTLSAISWNFFCHIVSLHCRINNKDYLIILGDRVYPMTQALISEGDGIFQDANATILSAHVVKNWYEEHDSELEHTEWPPQSPDLNIIEHL